LCPNVRYPGDRKVSRVFLLRGKIPKNLDLKLSED
jgi:hypothetical protein